ncbi:hypothetical protein SAMN04487759_11045 [Kandleria vitulina]|uniref:Integral membrane protein (Intg_mem_TP0381) n=1 Tax=Kandleria vitulina TaxID=1630 RepID=A0A1H2SQL9_9FIRM|nr:Pr6Pr family membrane protein [Kandleria vitulina]SDW33902.1 hypothetical protein SAMN04487759_11045 [Kandleria vitulina]
MILNKKFQLSYRIVFIILVGAGLLLDLMTWTKQPHNEFLVYYTTQSNIMTWIIMAFHVRNTYKDIKNKKTYGTSDDLIPLHFLAAIWILITSLVYNVLLSSPFTLTYWTSNLHNPILHLFGPILFILDLLLFSKRKQVKSYVPLLCVTYPYIYIVLILARGSYLTNLYHGKIPQSYVVYPYFFLDVKHLGYLGVLRWVMILSVVFILLSYLMHFIYVKTHNESLCV